MKQILHFLCCKAITSRKENDEEFFLTFYGIEYSFKQNFVFMSIWKWAKKGIKNKSPHVGNMVACLHIMNQNILMMEHNNQTPSQSIDLCYWLIFSTDLPHFIYAIKFHLGIY
jgi:hypothetical protein